MSAPLPLSIPVYRPRKPPLTPSYQCVQDHWEVLEGLWEERFRKRFGFLRTHLKQVMVNFLQCGDLHGGFARIRCDKCGNEYLLAYSCKDRHFCPSCHQKRTVEFAEWICGPRIRPGDKDAMENLASHIIRASFSQTRMEYFPEQGKVCYRSKDGREQKTYDALEWLAAMVSHLPLKGEQFVKYCGYHSNRVRGDRRKRNQDATVPSLLEPDLSYKEARRNWSRLIRKIHEVDPLPFKTRHRCHPL